MEERQVELQLFKLHYNERNIAGLKERDVICLNINTTMTNSLLLN